MYVTYVYIDDEALIYVDYDGYALFPFEPANHESVWMVPGTGEEAVVITVPCSKQSSRNPRG